MGEAAAVSLESGEEKREIWTKHYSSSHRILLVGEGDFSFSACLAKAFGSAKNMIATSYDNLDKLLEKYWTARIHLDELKSLGCTLLHGINVENMHEDDFLKVIRFDRIIFNFPHAGHFGFHETNKGLILRHMTLLCDFFNNARCLLNENGEIHVSHRDDHPNNNWDIRGSAKERGLILKEMVEFQKEDYPGYQNKRGGDIRSNETFPLGNRSFTFKILLVGEGDFSFSACLARAFGSAKNMIATSYDNFGKLLEKHRTATFFLDELKSLGCTLLHGINVENMHEDNFLKVMRFDRIIFNFPHAGHFAFRETNKGLILRNKKLLCDFFNSARCLLSENGEIHVSHRDDHPYNNWEIRGSANERGLTLKEKVKFHTKDYPGYQNKRGSGTKSNKAFPLGNKSFTFKFSLNKDLEDDDEIFRFI
ncbi:hypothetical protein IEQ34_005665 [Dendrobium chrysotoxum]|uniref:25S rRNA (uridine-N(3))-methyltransferase BMT5-like domain-containing protein n=1 Tax=Dendrobium chrysotoxum TaxID=161865 RepID=A0AAV7HAT9_DENCH|nr:hypothetical protein IEQ34_005665 [Dendrobium chrysotoxum]